MTRLVTLALLTGLGLLAAGRVLGAPAFAPEPEPATAGVMADAAADSGPSPAVLERLRDRVGRHPLRIGLGRESYEFERVRFDAEGFSFRPHERLDEEVWLPDSLRRRLVSPVRWSSVTRIERRSSRAGIGFVVVTAISGVLVANAIQHSVEWDDFTGGFYTVGLAVVPGLAGALIGSGIHSWHVEWTREAVPARAVRR